jgi:TRAP-type C4-dicarboxylate transport system permease small subunit
LLSAPFGAPIFFSATTCGSRSTGAYGAPSCQGVSMRNYIRTIDKNLERWLLLIFYVMLVITMAIEVLRREIFAYSSIWGEEIVRYSFIYLAWIGAAVAVKERGHIRIDVIVHYLGPRAKALIYILGDLVMFFVAVIALYWSWEAVHVSWKFGSVSHGLRVSMVWFFMAVPVGFALMILRLVQSFLRDIRSLRDGTPVYEGDKLFD